MKTETLVARVTPDLARKVQEEALRVGETEAYVIREALRTYFQQGDLTLRETPIPDNPQIPPVPPHQTETSYLKRTRKKKP